MGNWKEVFNELFNSIYESGLIEEVKKIYIGISGDEELYNNHEKIEIIHRSRLDSYEFITLDYLLKYCKENSDNKVLYIHTKGVSSSIQYMEAIDDWRKYMSYFVIENYKKCLDVLDKFNVCGVDWVEEPFKHFSGNFWWANAEYLNTLPEDWKEKKILTKRHNCEFLIGMNNNVRSFSLFNSNINVYKRHLHKFKRSQYEFGRVSN
jgi:hypothetical protein